MRRVTTRSDCSTYPLRRGRQRESRVPGSIGVLGAGNEPSGHAVDVTRTPSQRVRPIRIAVLGGGVSLAALFDLLLDALGTSEVHIRLAARDSTRLSHLAGHGQRRFAVRDGWTVEACTSIEAALEGADSVVVMLRVGGLEARRADEVMAQRFGLPADEGLGLGGMANALRTLPVINLLAAQIARVAPDAFVANLVAPLGLTTRVLLDSGLDAVGVCELPSVTEAALGAALPVETRLAYAGFNHLGWFWPINPDGRPVHDPLVALAPAAERGLVDPGTVTRFGAAPLKYYYWLHDPVAAERLGISRDPDRVAMLQDWRDDLRRGLRDDSAQLELQLAKRPTPWFNHALVPLLAARAGGQTWEGYGNVRNAVRRDEAAHSRLVDAFDPEVVVEVPVVVDSNGVHARPVRAALPPAVSEFSARVQRCEQLVYAAWIGHDRTSAEFSLIEGPHRLEADTARRIVDALWSASTEVTPQSGVPSSKSVERLSHDPMLASAHQTPTRFTTVRSTSTDYVVGVGAWSDPKVTSALHERPVVAVVDEMVAKIHGSLIDARLDDLECLGRVTMAGGEQAKTHDRLVWMLDRFEEIDLPKHGIVLSIGGGTVSDVAGLAALLMRRGVSLALFPTTLLAQVDAGVGGKNGIDSPATKNLIGHFHHPLVVASDPELLHTLEPREWMSGIAECIKVFAVADGKGLDRHRSTIFGEESRKTDRMTSLVAEAQASKLRLLAEDPYEDSSRRLLNYGHAFAHLLEERSKYQLLHGEAVLFGMLIENEVSIEVDIACDEVDELQGLLASIVSQVARQYWMPFEAIAPELDKIRQMRRSSMNLVCLRRPGDAVVVDDVSDDVLHKAWSRVWQRLNVRLSPSLLVNP